MSNSPLVDYTKISPNKTSPRNHKIDTVTIHCIVGQQSPEVLGAYFAQSSAKASSNYGIGPDGRIGMYVEEKDRAWTSSNYQNDDRAITIEVASDTKHPYAVKDAAYNALIDLLVDICQRNGIEKLLWKNDKSLVGQVDKQNMTVHRWFAAKACPGEYLFSRHGQIADAVNARLFGGEVSADTDDSNDTSSSDSGSSAKVPYTVYVDISDLAIWKGPSESYGKTGSVTKKGTFTIVEEQNGFGKLKSGAGWINLSLVNSTSTSEDDKYSDYTKIMGTPVATADQMIARIKAANPNVPQSVIDMIPHYLSEGKAEGVRGDVAFAQSCIETGNFTFPQSTCAVTIDQNNFAMMGVTTTFARGESFDTPQLGIRAQIQHLKAYASTEPLVNDCIDPRFTYVSRGCAPYVEWLGMKENPQGKGWASGKNYGTSILRVLDEILDIEATSDEKDEGPAETSKLEINTPETSEPENTPSESTKVPYTVYVDISDLAIWKGPSESYGKTGSVTKKGTFTIVEEQNGFGKLKSGAGWIPLTLKNSKEESDVPFTVKVDITYLNIRKGPGSNYDKTGAFTGKGIFTIVEVKEGEGSDSGWGRLKSGAGWISLDYTTRA